jgi:hypothetical protein|tara:strand:+ start:232 stop:477 length:246 start_codon:yes stop_codon:yes gene_type:complete
VSNKKIKAEINYETIINVYSRNNLKSLTNSKNSIFYPHLVDYITLMVDVVEGDIDPQIEFDVESDDQHRYIIVNILDKVLH